MQTNAKMLASHLKEIFNGDPWYGDNIQKKLSSINAEQAVWKPHPEAHSIVQVLGHMIKWKKQVIRKLKNNDPDHDIQIDSMDDWDTFFIMESPDDWADVKSDFVATQQNLLILLTGKTDDDLRQQVSNRTYNMQYLVNGIYEHDIYHLGQIGYIQSLWTKQQQPSPNSPLDRGV